MVALQCMNQSELYAAAMELASNDETYFKLKRFYDVYNPIHSYVSLAICIFGIPANIANCVVLTRPSMISAINCLLVAIAICDLFVLALLFVYVIHFNLGPGGNECNPWNYDTYHWTTFQLVYAITTVAAHAISLPYSLQLFPIITVIQFCTSN